MRLLYLSNDSGNRSQVDKKKTMPRIELEAQIQRCISLTGSVDLPHRKLKPALDDLNRWLSRLVEILESSKRYIGHDLGSIVVRTSLNSWEGAIVPH